MFVCLFFQSLSHKYKRHNTIDGHIALWACPIVPIIVKYIVDVQKQ